jgi:predicted alpha/beta hydrolase family esterase
MQIFLIHGGTTFATYEEYLNFLKTREIDIEGLKKKGWKDALGTLGAGYEVIAPRMPNAQNARYEEWKIWFERFIPFLHDGVVLIGHSLGGVFLAKYLSENDFPKKIKATLLVAAPYSFDIGSPLPQFSIEKPLTKFAKQGGAIMLYHSKDDQIVPFSELAKYQKELPNAKVRVFEDKGHFNHEEFPELMRDLQELTADIKTP